jgi:hypothetical protein
MKKLMSFVGALLLAFFEPAFIALSNWMHRQGLILAGSSFPNGTIFSLGTTYAAPKIISGISNANQGLASSTAHGFGDGDVLVISSGWPRLEGRVARADTILTDSFVLEGIDTSSTNIYPAGAGGGRAVKVTNFVPISQVTDSASSGGEQQFYQWIYVEDGQQRQRPTFKNARSLQLTLDYDPDLAWHNALLNADLINTPHVLMASLPNNSKIYYNMYVSFDGEPTFTANVNQQVVATFSYANPRSTRYAS